MRKVSADEKGLVLLGAGGARTQQEWDTGALPSLHRPNPHPDLKSWDPRNEEPRVTWPQ